MRWISALLLVFLVAPTPVAAEENIRAAWDKAERKVVAELHERDLGEWARALANEPLPKDTDALLPRMSVLLRAGHHKALMPVLRAVASLPGMKRASVSDVPQIATSLADSEAWEHLRVWLEGVPADPPSWDGTRGLTDHIVATESAQAAEDWLAARARARPRYWFRALVYFHKERGSLGDFIAGLEQAVRADPRDGAALNQYLKAREHSDAKTDVAWVAKVATPRLFSHCALAAGNHGIRDTKAALAFLERAEELSITEEDAEVLHAEGFCFSGDWKRMYRAGIKHQIVKTHLALGNKKKAQALMEALVAEHPNGLPPPGLAGFAGGIQRATGFRVVEKRVREAEAENKDSAKYWLARAEYFSARKEDHDARDAYRKALALSKQTIVSWPGGQPGRLDVIGAYAQWLKGRDKNVLWLFWPELESSDPASKYAAAVADAIAGWSGSEGGLSASDKRLWKVLEARKSWEHRPDERLLLAMAEGRTRDTFWWRAEQLTRGTHPSRAYILGRVMAEHRHARALPVLEDALGRMQGTQRSSAVSALFRACLRVYNWQRAEALWPEMRKRLTPDEQARWLGNVALAAARAGDKQEARLLWSRRVNLDRRMTFGLEAMVQASMRDELISLYAAMAKADPDSVHPRRMIEYLRTLE